MGVGDIHACFPCCDRRCNGIDFRVFRSHPLPALSNLGLNPLQDIVLYAPFMY